MFNNFWYTGGAHPGSYHNVINYDFTTGEVLTLADLFTPGSPYLNRLSEYSIQQLNENLDFEVWEDGAAPTPENYQIWAITPEGLLIIFEHYQVASYADGTQSVMVPYTAIESIINPSGPIGRFADKTEKISPEDVPTQTSTSLACPGLLPPRLRVSEYAYVNPEPPLPNLVRREPGVDHAAVGQIPPGGVMEILGGPECAN